MTRRGAIALLALLAPGCGFRLRRWDWAAAVQAVRVEVDRSIDLDDDLLSALRSAGVSTADGDADVIVALANQRDERRSVVATRSGRAAEYELSLQIEFTVFDAEGEALTPTRTLRSERVVRLDRDNIVGSSEEQALVERELRDDLIGRMMRALGALSKARAAATAR